MKKTAAAVFHFRDIKREKIGFSLVLIIDLAPVQAQAPVQV